MKKITRKQFLRKTSATIAGISLFPPIFGSSPTTSKTTVPLGKTGIMVTPLCYGASRTMDESLIRYALDQNINFLDTGRSYANGNNERLIGRVIAGRRKEVIVQSKIHLDQKELNFKGKGKRGYDEIMDILNRRIEESLTALDTDYIDVMLYHSAEEEYLCFHDAVLKFYDDQKRSGTIRAHGFSSHDYELNLVKRNNREGFYDVIMHPFNFQGSFIHSLSRWSAKWDQELLIELLKRAHSKGTGIIAMKTCSGGPHSLTHGEKATYHDAVKWVIEKEYIDSAAVAMPSYEQIAENLGIVER